MAEAELEINNRLGLHARAAAKVVSVASRYDASIQVGTGEKMVDARSIMGLLTLGAARGTTVRVQVTGPEADAALEELKKLFHERFDEED